MLTMDRGRRARLRLVGTIAAVVALASGLGGCVTDQRAVGPDEEGHEEEDPSLFVLHFEGMGRGVVRTTNWLEVADDYGLHRFDYYFSTCASEAGDCWPKTANTVNIPNIFRYDPLSGNYGSVDLTATPDLASGFGGWGGLCASSGRNLKATVEIQGGEIRSCTASFDQLSTGALIVRTSTTATTGSPRDADGYMLAVSGGLPAFNETLAIAPNGANSSADSLALLSPGAYDIALSGVASNCLVTDGNPRSVEVSAGQITRDTIHVHCGPPPPVGSIRVVVAATASAMTDMDADGYVITVASETWSTGGLVAAVCDQTSGPPSCVYEKLFTGVPAGAQEVTLSGIATNCTATPASTVTAGVIAGASMTVIFEVHCQPLAVVIEDDFNTGLPWSATVLSATGGSDLKLQSGTRGPGDLFRQMKDGHQGPSSIVVVHVFDGATYDPASQGAIEHVDFMADLIQIDNPTLQVNHAFALIQNGVVFTVPPEQLLTATWTMFEQLDLTADMFIDVDGSALHPDFSDQGAPMQFGYLRSSATSVQYPGDVRHGIDNWRTVVMRMANP